MKNPRIAFADLLSRRKRYLLATATGLVALVLFWLTLCPTAFPGEPAALLAMRLGIEPLSKPSYPLWQSFTAAFSHLSFNVAVYAYNFSSALFGALAVGLLCRYLVGWIDKRFTRTDALNNLQTRQAAMLGGIVAALSLATSIPFWTASTRVGVLSFYAVFLLLAFNLVQDYRSRGGRWRTVVVAALCGAGCAESFIFLLITPYFFWALLAALYKRTNHPWRHMWGIACAGLGGVCLYILATGYISSLGGTPLHGFRGTLGLSGRTIISQTRLALEMFYRTGWLWGVLAGFAPWLAIQFEARRGLNLLRNSSTLPFHFALVVVVLLVQFNAPFLPWAAYLPAGRLPVLEQILTAMVMGYLAAFWFLRIVDPTLRTANTTSKDGVSDSSRSEDRFIRYFSSVAGGVLLLFVLLASVHNLTRANGKRAAFADGYVNALLDQMRGRTWLVTDGMLDLQLNIAARRRNQPLNLINLAAERAPNQILHLRRKIAENPLFAEHTAVYRNAANLGAAAFIREWLATDTNAIRQLAFYVSPDLLIEAGLTQAPDELLFRGELDLEALANRPLLAQHQRFWNRMDTLLKGATTGDPVNVLRGALRRHVSMAANNLGVLLEDLGRPDEAYTAYRRALAFTPDNFSARLNCVVLTRKGIRPEDRAQAEADAVEALEKLKRRPDPGRLARFYGYVRVPAEFARQSEAWMLFGRPGMASAALTRALALAPDDQRQALLQRMAVMHLDAGAPEKSEALLQQILAQHPTDPQALLSMVRLSLMKQNVHAARDWLSRVKRTDVSAETLSMETATIDSAAGDFERAQHRLRQITDANPRNLQAWALLANVLLSQGRCTDVERDILPRMLAAAGKSPHYLVALTQGFTHLAQGAASFPAARNAFLIALALNPGNRLVLLEILKLDYALRDDVATGRDAAALLRLDPNEPFANYLMGMLLITRNDLEGAEAYLRRSLTAKASAPVWNDLAETLRMLGRLNEAENAARQSLAIDAQSPYAYDTLASILLEAGRLNEALQACNAALALAPETLPFTLTEVRILARMGELVVARKQFQKIRLHNERLPLRLQGDLDAVAMELDKKP